MTRNLGLTGLKKRRRKSDPMRAYDAMPQELRQWLAQAALPWSPASACKLWNRAQAQGLSVDDALAFLKRAETKTLSREKSWGSPTDR